MFRSWSDGNGILLSTQPTLNFVMQQRLSLIANFEDTRKPQLSILSPEPGQQMPRYWLHIAGTCSDNDRITNVMVSLNGYYFQKAKTFDDWKGWVLPWVQLTAGTNTIDAYAVDATGLLSSTQRTKVFFSVKSKLTLSSSGSGTLKTYFDGDLLEVGKSYRLSAVPGADMFLPSGVVA